MREFLKTQYQFSDFQVAQLNYLGKTLASEFSKLFIMGIIFKDILSVYAFAVVIMMLLRSSTGGLHCRKYISCFFVTFTYMFLSLAVLPAIPINKLVQMILLFFCILCNYYIGPVTSAVHRPLSEKTIRRVRGQAFVIIFFYLTLTYITPENPYITAGFWVIILHTAQLVAAKLLKIMKGVNHYEKQTYQME
ncbi:MAG: accessory gene regulator B family protein [Lachnospiraceae bacterium]|nr:accessory gene regulator B family protein [Lachnospiraceae bacterium]